MTSVALVQRSTTLHAYPPVSDWRQQRRLRQVARQRRQLCKAEAGGSPGQPGRDEVLERIKRAKEYKKQVSESAQLADSSTEPPQGQPAAAAPAVPASLIEPTSEDVVQTFNDAAQALAAKEEASFLAAISQAQSSSRRGSDASSTSSPKSPAGQSSGVAPSKEAVLARVKAARQYKQGGGAAGQGSSGGGSSSPGAPTVHPLPREPARDEQQPRQPQGQPPQPPASQQEQQQLDAAAQRSFRTGAGGADEAANWLKFAESSGGGGAQLDANLSAEQFTIAKEELKKQQEVEIVTVDAGYAEQLRREKRAQRGGDAAAAAAAPAAAEAAEADSDENLHKPKVATWGLFPRPRNISEAYGGKHTPSVGTRVLWVGGVGRLWGGEVGV